MVHAVGIHTCTIHVHNAMQIESVCLMSKGQLRNYLNISSENRCRFYWRFYCDSVGCFSSVIHWKFPWKFAMYLYSGGLQIYDPIQSE